MAAPDPIKVYDARWEAHEFSDRSIRRLFQAALAYGRKLNADTVTIARDARLGSAHVMEIAIDAALEMGFSVYACSKPVSTPQSYFLTLQVTREHPGTMGLTLTASHNPAQYVGVKFVVPVVQAIGLDCGPLGGLSEIRRMFHSKDPLSGPGGGSLNLMDIEREYIEYSLEQAGVASGGLSGLRVALDGFHGSAGPEMMTALDLAGVQVEPLRLIPDGNFPTGSPNPTSQGKMAQAVELACRRNCTAVIGLDGDGDRIVFGDRRGILTAGFAGIPILRSWIRRSGATTPVPVLYDPKVNPLALAEWGKLGVHPVLFRNGHSQIKEYMQRIGALAAAEESGHYYHRLTLGSLTASCENSILTVLLLLEALHQEPGVMDRLWDLEEQVATTGEMNYQFQSDEIRDQAMASVIEHFTQEGAAATTTTPDGIDLAGTVLSRGVQLDSDAVKLDSGWYSGYLRLATNEKGVVRSYFSAADRNTLARLEGEARQILERFEGQVID